MEKHTAKPICDSKPPNNTNKDDKKLNHSYKHFFFYFSEC